MLGSADPAHRNDTSNSHAIPVGLTMLLNLAARGDTGREAARTRRDTKSAEPTIWLHSNAGPFTCRDETRRSAQSTRDHEYRAEEELPIRGRLCSGPGGIDEIP